MPFPSRARRFAAAGLLASGALTAGCTLPANPPPSPTTTTTTAPPPASQPCSSSSTAIVCHQISVGGLTRTFYVHQSPQPAPAAGRPLVLWFHGDGGTGNANLSSLYAQTDPDGAVVVQLDGPNTIASLNRGGTAWSFFMDGSTPDDVGFAKTVVDGIVGGSLVPGAGVDPHRVYALGASRGGFMVDTLLIDARTAPVLAAGVSLSGNFYCETGDTVCDARINAAGFASAAPLLHIHGSADTVVDPPGRLPTPVTGSISWPWPLAQLADAHGCATDFAYAGAPSPSISGLPTYRYAPAGGCSVDDQLVLVQGAGHGFVGWEPHAWGYLKTKQR